MAAAPASLVLIGAGRMGTALVRGWLNGRLTLEDDVPSQQALACFAAFACALVTTVPGLYPLYWTTTTGA